MSGISQSSSPRSAASIAAAIVSGGATTDNAVARFDGVGGMLQDSAVIISDAWSVSGIANLTSTGTIKTGAATLDADATSAFGIPWLASVGNNSSADGLVIIANNANANGARISGAKTRSTSTDANTIVANGDTLTIWNAFGADGASYRLGGSAAFVVDGTPGASDMPTSFVLKLSPDGSATPSTYLTVSNAGLFTIAGSVTQSGATTFSTGTGAISLNGTTTVVSGKTLLVPDTTAATSTSTGAVVIGTTTNGGLGVAGAVWIGGAAQVATAGKVAIGGGQVDVTTSIGLRGVGSDTIASSPYMYWNNTSGAVQALQLSASNHLDIWSNNGSWVKSARVQVTGEIVGYAATDATTTTTGSLQIAGGVGIVKALFVGGTSLTLTNATPLINLNRATDGNPGKLQFTNAGGTKYNWQVAVQYNSDNAFEITPSTAAGGSTYSTAAISIAAATGLVSMAGALTVTGNATLNGPAFAVNATSAAGITITSATTNAVVNVLDARVNSSGTAAAGFGAGFTMRAESTTTDNTIQFELDSVWVVATHASRTSRALFYSQDSGGSRECMRIEASGTAAMIGFLGAAAVVRPATSGEATGFTAGAGTTATHLSTWTGNTGSTAYTTNDIVKHLKNLGLIAA